MVSFAAVLAMVMLLPPCPISKSVVSYMRAGIMFYLYEYLFSLAQ